MQTTFIWFQFVSQYHVQQKIDSMEVFQVFSNEILNSDTLCLHV